jgi:uncharacterized iron-regulated protein
MSRTIFHQLLFLTLLLVPTGCASMTASGDPELPYPPPRPPQIGGILHLPTGYYVPETALLDAAADARIVYVGETHDNPASHRLELNILQALQRRNPGRIALGMEMFTHAQQDALDRWSAGQLSEKDFIRESNWGQVWQMNFAYYRELLQFAKQNRIPVIGLNADRELVHALGRMPQDELPPEQRNQLPQLDLGDPYHVALVTAIYRGHASGQAMLDGFQRIQTLWDETMAENVARYLQSPQGKDRQLLVVAGGNHIRNGFGIPRRVFRRLPTSYLLVGSHELNIPAGMEDRLMDVTLPDFPMPAYDYLVYTAYETLPEPVKLGVMLVEQDGAVVVQAVVPGSVAADAEIREGDRVIAFDGQEIAAAFDLAYAVQQKKPGARGTLRLLRDGQELRLDVTFRAPGKPEKQHK